MIQAGENLSLIAKAPHDEVGIHAALDQFNGNPLLKFIVRSHCKIDRTQSAAANLLNDSIGAQALTDHRCRLDQSVGEGDAECRRANRGSGRVESVEECFDLAAERGIILAGTLQKSSALLRRPL